MSDHSQRPGRLGLALSGGGLRASLFHVGVLARLAELDLLREVQVISTVSGGSIIGALYYLHVRRLLESRADKHITRQEWIDLVATVADEFGEAITHNLRMRAIANPLKTLQMIASHRYSRSDRMAELYERFLYERAAGVAPGERVALPQLQIRPLGEAPDFDPLQPLPGGVETRNDQRRNKVPTLVINATTLNTGHSFQFTCRWLGEPSPRAYHRDLDRNLWLEPIAYKDAPQKYQQLPLGIAVAASAAVPGIFPPLALTDLYKDRGARFTPQLVDGGVQDNQGIGGLLDCACTHLIVSDASGQMDDVANPSTVMGSVIARTNAVLMDRVREEEYIAARLRKDAGEVRALVFFHLKDGIGQRSLVADGAQGCPKTPDQLNARAHGVHRDVQALLAGLRTDLDAFSEIEAHALMADGYQIAAQHVDDALRQQLCPQAPAPRQVDWAFLDVLPLLRDPERDPVFSATLAAGHRSVGKSLRLVPLYRPFAGWLRWAPAAAVLATIGAAYAHSGPTALTSAALLGGGAICVVMLLLLVALLLGGLCAAAQYSGWLPFERVTRALLAVYPGIVLALAGWIFVGRHRCLCDELRLDHGRVSRLLGRAARAPHDPGQQAA